MSSCNITMRAAILSSWLLVVCIIGGVSSFMSGGSVRFVGHGRQLTSSQAFQVAGIDALRKKKTATELVPERQQGQQRRVTVRCFFGLGGGAAKKGPPANYDAISAQAISAVQAGLKAGEKAMEVEFPTLASLNKMNDGSAKNRRLARTNTLNFVKKLVGAVGRGKKVYIVCCEPEAKAVLGDVKGLDVRDLNAKNLPPAKAGDVQIVVTPADQSQWKLAKNMAETATVVIVNGVFVNGYMPFEPVYYFKPISGWGSVVRQYPGKFTAYLTGSNKVVPCEAGLARQGEIRRPDLRSAANALSAAFREQESDR